MNELSAILDQLASLNYGGAVFLFAYGATWLLCAYLWRVLPPKLAVYATLFQGMVALPVALVVSWMLGMFEARPGGEIIAQLSTLISTSQLLILPLLIALVIKSQYTMVPIVFSFAGAVHFLPYAWLYQTPVYVVMPLLLVTALTVLYVRDGQPKSQFASRQLAGQVCLVTGGVLMMTGAVLVLVFA